MVRARQMRAAAERLADETLVIVGNGMVGHRLCERLRPRPGRRVVVFGEEPRPAYDRVRLSELFGGGSAKRLELHDRAWYAARGIELVLDDPVVVVDRARRLVRARSGREERYDRLVFATGSAPAVPAIEGTALDGVFVYRTVEDLERISAWAAGRRDALVVGGGLLGLEAAGALRGLGLSVTVLEAAPRLLCQQLDAEGGALVASLLAGLGIRALTDVRIEGITRVEGRLRLGLAGGAALDADLVLISTGIRPRDKLAAYCGLACGERGGILVDDELRTSDPDVFAVGDCAIHRGALYGLVAPGYRMADVLARCLDGEPARFDGADRSTRIKLAGIEVAVAGDVHAEAEAIVHRAPGVYRKLLVRGGRVVGAMGVGPWPGLAEAQRAVEARRRVWPPAARRFRRQGRLDAAAPPPDALPATAVVCHCLGVTRGALDAARAGGCATAEALARATGASTVCGGCAPALASLVGAPAAPQGGRRTFAAALGGASLALVAWLVLRPFAYADTVSGLHLDRLWRSGTLRQVTGFALLGLLLVEVSLAVRRRWRRLARGDLGRWRAVHGLVGALSLLLLALHTGLRGGAHLNRALFVDYLLVNAAGVAAGLFFVGGGAVGAGRARWQRATRLLHAALVWPLVALLSFHVLAAYWF